MIKRRRLTIYITSNEEINATEWGKLITATDSIITGVLNVCFENNSVTLDYKSEEI